MSMNYVLNVPDLYKIKIILHNLICFIFKLFVKLNEIDYYYFYAP